MNKEQMVALIMSLIETNISSANKLVDWEKTKQSVIAPMLAGITDGVSVIMQDMQSNIPPKDKINEMIYHINMIERTMRLTNSQLGAPLPQDKQGSSVNITPLT